MEHRSPTVPIYVLISKVYARRWLFAGVWALLLTISALIIMTLPARYAASAQVVVPKAQPTIVSPAAESPPDPERVPTEVLTIRSLPLVESSVSALDLSARDEFSKKPGRWDPLTRWTEQTFATLAEALGLRPLRSIGAARGTEPQAVHLANTVEEVARRLSVARIGESRLIAVSFWAYDPKIPHQFVNTLLEKYLALQAQTRMAQISETEALLARSLNSLRENLRQAEEALESHRKETGIIEFQDSSLIQRQITGLTEQLILVRGNRAEAESRIELSGSAETNRREADIQRHRERALDEELGRLRTEYERQRAAQIRARELEREVTAKRTMLDTFLAQHQQLQIQAITERPTASVQFWAEEPVLSSSPSRKLLVAVAALATAGLAAFLVSLYPGRARTPRQKRLWPDSKSGD